MGGRRGFFTQGSGRTPNCSACYLPSIFLTFTVPSCLLLSCQVYHPPCPSFLAPCPSRLPGDLFCFLLCFFFCFECLSLQVSVAGRSPFRSQRLQCKFPFPLGNALPCFGGFWGVFCFSVFVLFCFSLPFFSLLFGGYGRKWEQGGGRWILFIFLAHFQGVGVFFLICVMNKVVFENKKCWAFWVYGLFIYLSFLKSQMAVNSNFWKSWWCGGEIAT